MDRQPVVNRFKNKVAIVTGGASGIGRAIAEELCREGCAVCITGISEAGKATAKDFRMRDIKSFFYRVIWRMNPSANQSPRPASVSSGRSTIW